VSADDQKILDKINGSQEQWVKEVQNKIWNIQSKSKISEKAQTMSKELNNNHTRKRRVKWSTEEDEELRKRVRLHGEGNWKVILGNCLLISFQMIIC